MSQVNALARPAVVLVPGPFSVQTSQTDRRREPSTISSVTAPAAVTVSSHHNTFTKFRSSRPPSYHPAPNLRVRLLLTNAVPVVPSTTIAG